MKMKMVFFQILSIVNLRNDFKIYLYRAKAGMFYYLSLTKTLLWESRVILLIEKLLIPRM